jgi:hypothetical protein
MEDQEQPSHPPGMGGTEVVDDGERRKERSVEEGLDLGETGGQEIGLRRTLTPTPGRREKKPILPELGDKTAEADEQAVKRDEFPPLAALDGEECQPSLLLRVRKKQRDDRQSMQSGEGTEVRHGVHHRLPPARITNLSNYKSQLHGCHVENHRDVVANEDGIADVLLSSSRN